MKEVKVTIKNYRSFTDTSPLQIEVGPHFTALVGTNNSGKSSFLKMFFELRPFWEKVLTDFHRMFNPDWIMDSQYKGISDPEEIFCNTNSRPLSIEIEIVDLASVADTEDPFLTRVIATCHQAKPRHWRFQCFSSKNPHKPFTLGEAPAVSENTQTGFTFSDGSKLDCSVFLDVITAFRNALYVGSFRNAINEGAGEYFDLAVGTSLITTWNSWKTGDIKSNNRAIIKVTKDIQRIFDFEQLEINASESRTTLSIILDGYPHRLSELGSGLTQFIIVFGNVAIRRPSLILIDEPEINLHASLQIDFLTALASYATEGIIFATQSIGLARSVADRIYSFQKTSGGTLVKSFEAVTNYVEFVGELSFSAFKDMGCDRILLVEGVHDVKTVHQFLRMVKKDHQTVVMPLGGDQLARGGVEAELAELNRLSRIFQRLWTVSDRQRVPRQVSGDKTLRKYV